MDRKRLNSYKHKYYSQSGEDGIILEAVRRLQITHGYFVEFGAMDGICNSNCYNLYKHYGWLGCSIEGKKGEFELLQKNIVSNRVTTLNLYVTVSGENRLDSVLAKVGAPREFDLLSIDIDSDDYAVWASLQNFTPKLVIIEYNRTIPNSCRYIQPLGSNKGNAPRSIVELGKCKGYVAFAATDDNLLFVAENYFSYLNIEIPSLDDIRDDPGCIFHAYDGEIVCIGSLGWNQWQSTPVIQPLPRVFRYFGKKSIIRDSLKLLWVIVLILFARGARETYAVLEYCASRLWRKLREYDKRRATP